MTTILRKNPEWEKNYDILFLPPKRCSVILEELGLFEDSLPTDSAGYRIAKYVRENRGKLIGICAGAMAMGKGIVTIRPIQNPAPLLITHMTPCGLSIMPYQSMHYKVPSQTLETAQLLDPKVDIPFYDSPGFLPSKEANLEILARYQPREIKNLYTYEKPDVQRVLQVRSALEARGMPAIVGLKTPQGGKVLAIGPHPEVGDIDDLTHFRGLHNKLPDAEVVEKVAANLPQIRKIWQLCMDWIEQED